MPVVEIKISDGSYVLVDLSTFSDILDDAIIFEAEEIKRLGGGDTRDPEHKLDAIIAIKRKLNLR